MHFFDVGKIIATHGLKGEVKVSLITDFADDRFAPKSRLYLSDNHEKALIVKNGRPFKNYWLVTFENVDDIDEAEKLVGETLVIKQDDQTDLEEGSYYYYQILNNDVFDNQTKEKIGTVVDIEAPGANDIWEIKPITGKNFWIPNIKSVVKKVDTDNHAIYVELIEGLRDED